MVNIKNILVPTDCSEVSDCALKYAIKFAKQFDAQLALLMVTVSEPITILNDYGYFSPELHQKLITESDKRAKADLESFWERSADNDVKAILLNFKGDPFTEIVRYTEENDVDIIIMGTHGRTGLKHVFMGSVAEKVVRYSDQPVLTIKHKDYQFNTEDSQP
jgi:nucleotide-binding universal stress UspA family protein